MNLPDAEKKTYKGLNDTEFIFYHTRLLDSAAYFGFPASREQIEAWLETTARDFKAPQRVRLLLGRAGRLTGESAPFITESSPQPLSACLAARPVQSSDVFLFHKTTNRAVYESAKAARPNRDEVLLYNERGELTEFSIGNLVVELDGALYTPPLDCGLLPGVFRAHLLETGQVTERIIRVEDLPKCAKIFLVNSVRQWREVSID